MQSLCIVRQSDLKFRYDYTGLTEDESLGMGWKLPFHPDDMTSTGKRWAHSLKTGDPYNTEYRCRSKDGEWRWMLGRALPMRNAKTGAIEKWFGTCTDIHEAVESRFAARRMVCLLLCHGQHSQSPSLARTFSESRKFQQSWEVLRSIALHTNCD